MVKKRISKKIVDKISKYVTLLKSDGLVIDQVYLFGSRAKGTQHKYSDIDVCIVSEKFNDQWEAFRYLNSEKFSVKSDIISIEGHGFNNYDFNNPYLTLPHEIKTYGIKIL